jgi:hypothetical protein
MKTIKIIFGTLLLAGMLASCDYLQQPYTVQGPNGCTSPEPSFTPRTNPVRKVLIEDFTGHFCGNCPEAHVVINNLLSSTTYAEKVVAVAHHSSYAGTFTEPWLTLGNPDLKFTYDFRNPISSEIDYKYNGLSYPIGLVNRKMFGSTQVVGHNTWQSHVNEILNMPQAMDIQLVNYYDPAQQSVCSYYYTQALTQLTGDYKILLFLTEDSIIQWQKNKDANPMYVPDYLHRHIMRASFNGLNGTPVNEGGYIASGETHIDGFSISTANTDWNIAHLKVVAFVYNTATEEIIQVEEVPVLP